jgi:hypothetical protein
MKTEATYILPAPDGMAVGRLLAALFRKPIVGRMAVAQLGLVSEEYSGFAVGWVSEG